MSLTVKIAYVQVQLTDTDLLYAIFLPSSNEILHNLYMTIRVVYNSFDKTDMTIPSNFDAPKAC